MSNSAKDPLFYRHFQARLEKIIGSLRNTESRTIQYQARWAVPGVAHLPKADLDRLVLARMDQPTTTVLREVLQRDQNICISEAEIEAEKLRDLVRAMRNETELLISLKLQLDATRGSAKMEQFDNALQAISSEVQVKQEHGGKADMSGLTDMTNLRPMAQRI